MLIGKILEFFFFDGSLVAHKESFFLYIYLATMTMGGILPLSDNLNVHANCSQTFGVCGTLGMRLSSCGSLDIK
jgi:hypothetical protein